MSYGVGCRHGSDLVLLLLWLWRRPTAVARVRPLAWEPLYATGSALKRQKQTNQAQDSVALGRASLSLVGLTLMLIKDFFFYSG